MLILNTGGTFNKRYDPIAGELFVPRDNQAVEAIMATFAVAVPVEGLIYKDSLEMDETDRAVLCDAIALSTATMIVVVHGTDTVDKSALAVAAMQYDKTVVFTGAMIPFSIDPVEATANLAMAIGYARNAPHGVHIVMQGVCGTYDAVVKNREAGKFKHV